MGQELLHRLGVAVGERAGQWGEANAVQRRADQEQQRAAAPPLVIEPRAARRRGRHAHRRTDGPCGAGPPAWPFPTVLPPLEGGTRRQLHLTEIAGWLPGRWVTPGDVPGSVKDAFTDLVDRAHGGHAEQQALPAG